PHRWEDCDAFSRRSPRSFALWMLDAQGPSCGVQIAGRCESKLLDAEASVVVEGQGKTDCRGPPIRDAVESPHRVLVPRVILDVNRFLRAVREMHDEFGLVIESEPTLSHPCDECTDLRFSEPSGVRGPHASPRAQVLECACEVAEAASPNR